MSTAAHACSPPAADAGPGLDGAQDSGIDLDGTSRNWVGLVFTVEFVYGSSGLHGARRTDAASGVGPHVF
eukprot:2197957-Rhodomonas_salina.1